MGKKLTPKQQQFVERYLVHFNATKAYRESYPNCKSDKTAATNGGKMLRNAEIQAKISEGQAEISRRNQVDQDWIVQRLKWQADARMSKVARVQGQELLLREDMTDEELDCLDSYSKTDSHTQFGHSEMVRWKVKDPTRSLELLGKHIGMWESGSDGTDGKGKGENQESLRDAFSNFLEKLTE